MGKSTEWGSVALTLTVNKALKEIIEHFFSGDGICFDVSVTIWSTLLIKNDIRAKLHADLSSVGKWSLRLEEEFTTVWLKNEDMSSHKNLRVRSINRIDRNKNTNVYSYKLHLRCHTPMQSEYKGEFQHRFRSKCYRHIFLNLPRKKNLEVIPFTLIPEKRQSNTP